MSKILAMALAALPLSAARAEPAHPPETESRLVAVEACGAAPAPSCLMELRKVCHAHPTFRCYYSFKPRLDMLRQVGFTAPHAEEE